MSIMLINRIAESWRLFLIHDWSYQIKLPKLADSFQSILDRNKPYSKITMIFLTNTWIQEIVVPNLGDSFYDKTFYRISVPIFNRLKFVFFFFFWDKNFQNINGGASPGAKIRDQRPNKNQKSESKD